MTRYLVQHRNIIFVKGYGFLYFAKNMNKRQKIGRKISKYLSGKYSLKLLDHAKQSATDAIITTSERLTQNTAEPTGDLIGDKTTDKITKILKTSPQYNSEALTNKHNKEVNT